MLARGSDIGLLKHISLKRLNLDWKSLKMFIDERDLLINKMTHSYSITKLFRSHSSTTFDSK